MKTRLGFVSNSSSSSFLIGLGVSTDPENIEKLKEKASDYYYVEILPLKEIIETPDRLDELVYNDEDGVLSLSSFDDYTVSIHNLKEIYNTNTDAVIVYIDHMEGDDSDFWDEDTEDYDYKINLDFFSQDAVESVQDCETLCDSGSFEWGYGAGRNG